MIDKIVEMIISISIPQGIMIGFCAFLFVTVIIIIWWRTRRTISTLIFILEEIRRINISLNNIEVGMGALTYAVNNSEQGSHLHHKKDSEPDAVGVKVQG
jgi:hypothetical protein